MFGAIYPAGALFGGPLVDLGAVGTVPLLAIGGIARDASAPGVLYPSLTIVDGADEQPTTLGFTTFDFVPTEGQEVVVTFEGRRLFAGTIQTVTQRYGRKPATIFADVSAIDYTPGLNRHKVTARFLTQSATDIAIALLAAYAPNYSTAGVQTALPTVDEITFTNQDLTDCLTQLTKRIGASWYADYDHGVHVFTDEYGDDPSPLTPTHASLESIASTRDMSQIVTRVLVEGGGVNALTEVWPGQTSLPVEDAAWYAPGGGVVVAGPQRLSYTGVQLGGGGSLVGPGAAPSTAPSLARSAGAGLGTGVYGYAVVAVTAAGKSLPSPLAAMAVGAVVTDPTTMSASEDTAALTATAQWAVGDSIFYKVTYLTATGETLPSPASATIVATVSPGNPGFPHLINVVMPVSADPAVTQKRLYRNRNGAWVGYLTFANATSFFDEGNVMTAGSPPGSNTTATWQVSVTGIALGASPTTSREIYRTAVNGAQLKLLTTIANNTSTGPYVDSAADGSLGANAPTADTSGLTQPAGQVNAGSVSLLTANAGPFASGGGWAVTSAGQAIRYTGITGNTLTGIPASGIGAILTTVLYGSQVLPAPALTGIPAAGPGAILVAILKGDPINVLVTVDDVAAQAALAALLGAGDDGITEDYLQDRRLSITEATARGHAQLALRSHVDASLRYTCRDTRTRAGRTITAAMPAPQNIAGVFRLQRVTFSNFHPRGLIPPLVSVEASSSRFSFEDLLRMMGQRSQYTNL